MGGDLAKWHRSSPERQRRSDDHKACRLVDDHRFKRGEPESANKQREAKFGASQSYQAAKRSDNCPAAERRCFIVSHVRFLFRSVARNVPLGRPGATGCRKICVTRGLGRTSRPDEFEAERAFDHRVRVADLDHEFSAPFGAERSEFVPSALKNRCAREGRSAVDFFDQADASQRGARAPA